MKSRRGMARWLLLSFVLVLPPGCDDGPSGIEAGSAVEIALTGLHPLDPETEGSYAAWAYTSDGTAHPLGSFELPPDGVVTLTVPASDVERFAVTLEPPGDADLEPSPWEIVAGRYRGRSSTLTINGSVTAGPPLNEEPGHHSLFTSSNNVKLGYPSYENAGLWMFSIAPSENRHGTREVMVTPLRRSWLYEGWIVHRYGTPDAVWISYGKFRPDNLQLLSSRDDTGSGPFSGDEDYRNGGIEDVPGEEWTVNRFGLPVPGGLELPLQLDAVDESGQAVWTHVITIEPSFDEDEPLLSERPFPLQPYRNAIGAGGPGVPRRIMFQGDLPVAEVRVVR